MEEQKSTVGIAKTRLSYSFGAFGHDLFYNTLSTYFIIFVTNHLFNSSNASFNDKMIGLMTGIIFILRLCELVIDPFIGNAIDKTKTRWGKFKPWVIIGGTVSAITLTLLFTDLWGLTNSPIAYLIVFSVIYITMDIFYSFKDVGLWSMLPALSFDSHEREKTATFARIGSTLGGNLLTVIVMPIVLFFSVSTNGGTGDNRGWFVFALIVSVTMWLGAVAIGFGTKEVNSKLRVNKQETSFKKVLSILFRNDQLMWLALAYLCYGAGAYLVNSLQLYYFTYILGDSSKYSILGILTTIIGLLSVSLFPSLAKKFNRRKVFFWSIAIMVVALGIFAFANKSLLLVLIAAVLFNIPQPLIFLVVLMTMTDIVEYGQLKLGHRDESLTLSVRPLIDKLSGAITNGVVGLTAVAAGMSGNVTASMISSNGKLIFKSIMFGAPVILLILSVFVFRGKVTLTEDKHAEIVDELERTWGKNLGKPANDGDGSQEVTQLKLAPGEYEYASPVSGKIVPLNNVSDSAFSSGSMGKGVAIAPSDGRIYAPFDGIVQLIFPTRHAVGVVSDSGLVTLIHIGIGTVKLKGVGFVSYVERGQHVKKGDLLIEFWDPTIKKEGLDDTIIITILNSNELTNFNILKNADEDIVSLEPLFIVKK